MGGGRLVESAETVAKWIRMWVMKAHMIGHLQGLRRVIGGRMAQYYDPLTAESYESKKSGRCMVM